MDRDYWINRPADYSAFRDYMLMHTHEQWWKAAVEEPWHCWEIWPFCGA